MALVIVVLLNILIAQLSYTYSEAKKTAKLQYAIDTMFIVTRLEYSRLARWVRFILFPLFVSIRFFSYYDMCLILLGNYFLFLMPATQGMAIAVVKSHTRVSRERLAREEANGPYFSRPRDSLRSTLAILK